MMELMEKHCLKSYNHLIKYQKSLSNCVMFTVMVKSFLMEKLSSLSSQTVNNIFQKIEGFIQKPEGVLLYELAYLCSKRGVIVELGSWKGLSTVFLGLGSQAGSKKKIYAIDHFKGEKSLGFRDTFLVFKKNIHHFKLQSLVIPIRSKTQKAAKSWKKPIALLWIDASHDYKNVLMDFKLWEPFVINKGVIAMHDTLLPNPPRKVLEQYILPKHRFKIIRFVESIIVLQKVKRMNLVETSLNYFYLYWRDISYFLYINSWPIRRLLSKFKLYHQKDL